MSKKNYERELREYVKEHVGEDNINIVISTSFVDGLPRLSNFEVSGQGIRVHGSIGKEDWTRLGEERLVTKVKKEIDDYVTKTERESLRKSIMKQLVTVLGKRGFCAKDSYNGVLVLSDPKNSIVNSTARLIFKITVNINSSKIIVQYKDSRNRQSVSSPMSGDCFIIELADPKSLDDGVVLFLKKIAVDEADARLKRLKSEIDKIQKAKSNLDNDMHESVKYIMPGFING